MDKVTVNILRKKEFLYMLVIVIDSALSGELYDVGMAMSLNCQGHTDGVPFSIYEA